MQQSLPGAFLRIVIIISTVQYSAKPLQASQVCIAVG
jgi:hypothetical protein